MKLDNLSLPHPVLGISDDIAGTYVVENPNIDLRNDPVIIKIKHSLSNKSLEHLIHDNKVAFCTEIHCKNAFFRQVYSSFNDQQEIRINANDIRDTVDLLYFLIAEVDIPDYSIEGTNSDYAKNTFYISKGDVIGYGGETSFIAEKKYQAYKAVSSFMDIVRDDTVDSGPIKVDMSGDKITVHMPKNEYLQYSTVRKDDKISTIFHSSIVFPVLVQAIAQLNNRDYEESKWVQILKDRLASDDKLIGVDNSEVVKIAQILLDNPIKRTLDKIEQIVSEAS